MAGSDSGAVVAMKIFVEENQIPPVRILLELFCRAVDRPPALFIAKKNIAQTTGNLISHLPQRELLA
jgi:hypothetical protein